MECSRCGKRNLTLHLFWFRDTQHGVIGRARTVLGYAMIHTYAASARSILRITITQSQAHDDNPITDVGAVLYY